MAQLRVAGIKASPPAAPTAKVRVAGVAASGTASARARLRVDGISAYGTTLPGAQLRVAGITAAGTAALIAKLRVAGIKATGSQAIALASIADRSVDPFTEVTTAVSVLSGGPATSYEWRQLEGPVVALRGIGASRTFDALGMLDRHVVVLGVTALDAGGSRSAELRITVNVRPQTMWISTGDSWAPMPVLYSNGASWVATPVAAL